MTFKKTLFARELRKRQTPSENILWQVLRNRQLAGFKFHRQYVIRGFILDFYCPVLKLGIEVDGYIHNLKYNKQYDLEREAILKQYNVTIIRFTNSMVEKNLSGTIEHIKLYINKFPSLPEGTERG